MRDHRKNSALEGQFPVEKTQGYVDRHRPEIADTNGQILRSLSTLQRLVVNSIYRNSRANSGPGNPKCGDRIEKSDDNRQERADHAESGNRKLVGFEELFRVQAAILSCLFLVGRADADMAYDPAELIDREAATD